MKLYLVQHGEAVSKEENPDRPLSAQGMADVTRLAGFLKQTGVTVDSVIHSGKTRARQTAEILANELAPGVELDVSGLINPNDNPKAFDWQSDSWDKDMLVVGHLPFMAKLVSHLLLGEESKIITAYRPGSIVCLEMDSDMHCQLNWMVRPELLA